MREYTRSRRNVMQMTMFFVLLGTVGLAALLDQRIGAAAVVPLGPEQAAGPLHFKLPAGWTQVAADDLDPTVVAQASQGQRTIRIYRQHIRRMLKPEAYLDESGMFSDIFGDQQDASSQEVDQVMMGGVSALRVRGLVPHLTMMGQWMQSESVICAVFPNRQVVTLRMSDRTEDPDADEDFLDEIAASIRVDQ